MFVHCILWLRLLALFGLGRARVSAQNAHTEPLSQPSERPLAHRRHEAAATTYASYISAIPLLVASLRKIYVDDEARNIVVNRRRRDGKYRTSTVRAGKVEQRSCKVSSCLQSGSGRKSRLNLRMPAENFERERERMKKREAVETLSSDEGERKRGKQSLKNK